MSKIKIMPLAITAALLSSNLAMASSSYHFRYPVFGVKTETGSYIPDEGGETGYEDGLEDDDLGYGDGSGDEEPFYWLEFADVPEINDINQYAYTVFGTVGGDERLDQGTEITITAENWGTHESTSITVYTEVDQTFEGTLDISGISDGLIDVMIEGPGFATVEMREKLLNVNGEEVADNSEGVATIYTREFRSNNTVYAVDIEVEGWGFNDLDSITSSSILVSRDGVEVKVIDMEVHGNGFNYHENFLATEFPGPGRYDAMVVIEDSELGEITSQVDSFFIGDGDKELGVIDFNYEHLGEENYLIRIDIMGGYDPHSDSYNPDDSVVFNDMMVTASLEDGLDSYKELHVSYTEDHPESWDDTKTAYYNLDLSEFYGDYITISFYDDQNRFIGHGSLHKEVLSPSEWYYADISYDEEITDDNSSAWTMTGSIYGEPSPPEGTEIIVRFIDNTWVNEVEAVTSIDEIGNFTITANLSSLEDGLVEVVISSNEIDLDYISSINKGEPLPSYWVDYAYASDITEDNQYAYVVSGSIGGDAPLEEGSEIIIEMYSWGAYSFVSEIVYTEADQTFEATLDVSDMPDGDVDIEILGNGFHYLIGVSKLTDP